MKGIILAGGAGTRLYPVRMLLVNSCYPSMTSTWSIIRFLRDAFGKWYGSELSDENTCRCIYRRACSRILCTIRKADICYKCTKYYRSNDEEGIRWDDKELDID